MIEYIVSKQDELILILFWKSVNFNENCDSRWTKIAMLYTSQKN